jgi:hypothetical protein
MNKKRLVIGIIIIAIILVSGIFLQKQEKGVPYTINKNSTNYIEYEFDPTLNPDTGSRDILQEIEKSKKSLHGKTLPIPDGESMQYIEVLEEHEDKTIIQKYSAGNDIYELHQEHVDNMYSMYKNGSLLFKKNMEYGAEGPILEWRIVEGKPAFTIRLNCLEDSCKHDIFYEGEYISQKYTVLDPRYLFVYKGELGFVAKDSTGRDKIFYNGNFITESFDTIHTYNCCSVQQLLPTVYENGVLVFYANRADKGYLIEVKL